MNCIKEQKDMTPKTLLHRNLEGYINELRKTGRGQAGDGKNKHQRLMNQ